MSNEKKFPKAMYRGKLPIGNLELDCYVLDDETRILSATSVFTAFGRSRSGLSREKTKRVMSILNQNIPNHGWSQIPPFLGSKGIVSLVNTDDLAVLRPVEFLDGENKIQGYKAELLPRLCNMYLEARRNGTLDRQQTATVKQAEILLSAFAIVGIIALVDEATGYEKIRETGELIKFFKETMVREIASDKIREFEKRGLFDGLYKIYNIPRKKDTFEYENKQITLPLFLASKTLFPLIESNVIEWITPVEFLDGENIKKGYKAEILPGSEIIA